MAPSAAACTVYFDGACPLCRREIAHYRRKAAGADIAWVDAASCEPGALGGDLTRSAALARLHVRTADGTLVSGAAAFATIWSRVPGYRWLAAVASPRPVLRVLEAAYVGFLRLRPLWRRAEAAGQPDGASRYVGAAAVAARAPSAPAMQPEEAGHTGSLPPRRLWRDAEAVSQSGDASRKGSAAAADARRAPSAPVMPWVEAGDLGVLRPRRHSRGAGAVSRSNNASRTDRVAAAVAVHAPSSAIPTLRNAADAPVAPAPNLLGAADAVGFLRPRPTRRGVDAALAPDGASRGGRACVATEARLLELPAVDADDEPGGNLPADVVARAPLALMPPAAPAAGATSARQPLPAAVLADLRTDHAGEVGAVQIYRGVLAMSDDGEVRAFAAHHLATELLHLQRIRRWLPAGSRSRLLPLWRAAGWLAGAVPALLGARAVFVTVAAVERFVDRHYAEQIERLAAHPQLADLRATLEACRRDEIAHRDDALARLSARPGPLASLWAAAVGKGSALAVAASRRF